MKTIFWYLICVVFLQFVISEHQCDEAPPGQYCTDDLNGFHDCTFNKISNQYEDRIIRCPQLTRCSCFLRNKCPTSSELTECELTKTICQNYADPNFVTNFLFDYSGTITTSGPTGSNTRHIQGIVMENTHLGLFKKVEWDGPLWKFEYIVKDTHSGKANKYIGIIPGECTKTELSEFPLFRDEIEKYTRKSKIVTDFGTVQESWEFQKGRLNNGDTLTKSTWITERFNDTVTGYELSKPISFYERFEGSNLGKTIIETKWTVGLFYHYEFSKEYFNLPLNCIHL